MKRKTLFVASLTVILISFLIAVFAQFNGQVKFYLNSHIKDHLEEIVKPNVVSFNMQISEQNKRVNTIAKLLSSDGHEIADKKQLDFLRIIVSENAYADYGIAFLDGTTVSCTDNDLGNVSDKIYFKKSLNGESYVALPEHDENTVNPMITFSSPIERNGKIVAVLLCKYPSSELDSIFKSKFIYSLGEIFVVDANGDKIIGTSEYLEGYSNIIEFTKERCTVGDENSPNILTFNKENETTMVRLNDSKKAIFLTYSKLDYGDWYMAAMVDEDEAYKSFDVIFVEQQKFMAMIAVAVVSYLVVILTLTFSDMQNTDKLTGGLTFQRFKRKAKKLLKKNPNKNYVFVKLDVRNFKIINRIYSFTYGDSVIKNIAKSLDNLVKTDSGMYCRTGVDEFIVLIPFVDREHLDKQREKFITMFNNLMGEEFNKVMTYPTGQTIVTIDDPERLNIESIIEKVNFAHREAKKRNGDVIIDYMEDLENKEILAKSIEDRMNDAFDNDEFKLYLQPKVSIQDNNIVRNAEALIRWEYEGRVFMYPNDFIPLFETNGFIIKTDMLIFEKSVKFIRRMLDENRVPIRISVNFSRMHLQNKSFVKELCEITDKYNVPHECLEIELTESVLTDNTKLIEKLIKELHEEKFTLSMDDFGSGYSSLALLKDIEVDVIKIDKEFFKESKIPTRSIAVIESIINMAKKLNAKTVAEGVELEDQVNTLRELGCDMIQGYYYFRPISSKKLDLDIFHKEFKE